MTLSNICISARRLPGRPFLQILYTQNTQFVFLDIPNSSPFKDGSADKNRLLRDKTL